ncbi:UNVERIFIED_ORG: hypothetical protein FHR35_001381 [Microbispora rosea subsp. rosea]
MGEDRPPAGGGQPRALNVGRAAAFQAVMSEATGTVGGDVPGTALEDPAALPPELLRQVASGEPVTWYDDTKPDQPWMWAAVRDGSRVLAVKVDMGAERRSLQALDRHIVMATLAALAIVVPLAARCPDVGGQGRSRRPYVADPRRRPAPERRLAPRDRPAGRPRPQPETDRRGP